MLGSFRYLQTAVLWTVWDIGKSGCEHGHFEWIKGMKEKRCGVCRSPPYRKDDSKGRDATLYAVPLW
jgi:hypothetical protein